MKANEYKEYKGIRKESLRDNMTRMEVILTDLGEEATRMLTNKKRPEGLDENKLIARTGRTIAKNTRDNLENELEESVISNENNICIKYNDMEKLN